MEGEVKTKMKLVNLTPHPIRLVGETEVEIGPSGLVARVKAVTETVGEVVLDDGTKFPIVRTKFEGLEGLPDPEPDTFFVASTLVAQAASRLGRHDILAPDTGPESAIRDADGKIVGVRRLQQF